MKQDTYLTADQCKDYGFADEIYTPSPEELKNFNRCIILNSLKRNPSNNVNSKPNPIVPQIKEGQMPEKELQEQIMSLSAKLAQSEGELAGKTEIIKSLQSEKAESGEKLKVLTNDKASLEETVAKLNKEIKDFEVKIKNQEHQTNIIEINALCLKLQAEAKIKAADVKPDETDAEKLSPLARKLLNLKESTVMFNSAKSLYDYEVEQLNARQPLVQHGKVFNYDEENFPETGDFTAQRKAIKELYEEEDN